MGRSYEAYYVATKQNSSMCVRQQDTLRDEKQREATSRWHSRVWCCCICEGPESQKVGCQSASWSFVGYDSESKGYRIYWPGKQSITVERNVIFNQNDVREAENITISSGDTLSEGEKDKIIQNPESNVKVVEKYKNDSNSPVHHQSEPGNTSTVQEEKESNTIPFPTVPETKNQPKINIQ